MILAFLAAGAAAVCYGVASVFQAVGARRAAHTADGSPLLVRVARQLPYVAGLGLDLVGFVLVVLALHSLPLFLVQSLIAANVGVTAVAAVVFLHARLRAVEVLALGTLALGLVLLAVGAKPGPAHPLSETAQWMLLAALAPLAAVALAATRRSEDRYSVILLAMVAGTAFGAVGIAARGLGTPTPWWHIVAAPAAWAIVGFGVLGVAAFATALQRGSVTVVAGVMSGTETLLPTAVGFTVLGDEVHAGWGVPATATGFVCTLVGVFLLAPYADVEAS